MNASLHEALNNHQLWLVDRTSGFRFTRQRLDLLDLDLTTYDLSEAVISHCNLNGTHFGHCIGASFVCSKGQASFVDADVSSTSFEKADSDLLTGLVGAWWNGNKITKVTDWVVQDYYWAFRTDQFVQIGCMQKTLTEWNRLGSSLESLSALHDEQPAIDLQKTFDWWNRYKLTIWSSMS